MEAELAVETDMLGALREGEEAGMADTPSVERITGSGDQTLADALIVEVGTHRERAEETDAAPADREIRAQELAIPFGRERGDVLGAETGMGIRREREVFEIGCAEKSTEGVPDDALSLGQVALDQRTDDDHDCSCRIWLVSDAIARSGPSHLRQ